MKLRGLPTDMCTGPVDVRHIKKSDLIFLPCGFCKFFHVEYFMCDMGHVTCVDCGIEELKKVHTFETNAPCWGCGTRVSMIHVSMKPLLIAGDIEQETLVCPCGYEGDLRQIHVHLRESKYMYGCVLSDKSLELMELDHFKKSIFDLDTIKHRIEYAGDNLGTLFSIGLVKTLERGGTKLDELAKIKKYIRIVEKRIERVKAALKNIHSMNHELLPTLEAAFRRDCWLIIDFNEVSIPPQNYFETVISGVPLGLLTRREVIDNEIWLGIHLCGSVANATAEARKSCYPLRVKVTIRLHDSLGYIRGEVCMLTYKDGVFACPSFEDPSTEKKRFVGTPKFISMKDLDDVHLQFQKRLCFSFQIEPLYEKTDVSSDSPNLRKPLLTLK